MRYELKIVLPKHFKQELLTKLRCSKYFINEIYEKRQVNNIYFDTVNYTDYLASVNGNDTRKKYRIRWYGELVEDRIIPQLECKYKQGMAGGKNLCELLPFHIDEEFDYVEYYGLLKRRFHTLNETQQYMIGELLSRVPVLINTYERQYFMTLDGKYRLTIDENMLFYNYNKLNFSHNPIVSLEEQNILLEVKFDVSDVVGAKKLINELGYRLGKNSKYVNGINSILGNI